MADVKKKYKGTIQKGTSYTYNPATFLQEHYVENFHVVDSAAELLRKLQNCGKFAFDSETFTTGLTMDKQPTQIVRRWVGTGKQASPQDFPFCFSFYDGKDAYTVYDTLANRFKTFKEIGRELLEDKTREKIIHNAKFDMHIAENIGIKIQGLIHDTVLVSKLVDENRNSFKLMDLVRKIPGHNIKFEYMVDAYKKAHKINDYSKIDRQLMTYYANADVLNCWLLFHEEYPILEQDELVKLYMQELELMIGLYESERFGMKTDSEYLAEQKVTMLEELQKAEQSIYDVAGNIFNINSTQQLYNVLINGGVKATDIPVTEKGNPSLDNHVMAKIENNYDLPIVTTIMGYRKLEKLYNTYIIGIDSQRDQDDRVHGSVNQTEAVTGRMSVTKPALQTLPKKDKRIRRAFIPANDFTLYMMDLDQVEYRGLAHYSKCTSLCEAIQKGLDVHTATASILYQVPYEEVDDETQRTPAKTVNFSLVYGQGDDATAASLKMSVSDAKAFKQRYFASLPEVQPFIRTVQEVVRQRGYLKNFYDRRRRLKYDEAYKGPNALIQGWAADYIKSKLVRIYRYLKHGKFLSRILMVVHDEAIFEIHKDEEHIVPVLRWLMSDFSTFRVPITAGVDKGAPSWAKKEKVDCGFQEPTGEELEWLERTCLRV